MVRLVTQAVTAAGPAENTTTTTMMAGGESGGGSGRGATSRVAPAVVVAVPLPIFGDVLNAAVRMPASAPRLLRYGVR